LLANQTTKVGVVKEVGIYYYSDQTAETRIILGNDDEIWFNGVASVSEKDTVTATGKPAKLLDTLKQSHPKGVVDEMINEMIKQRMLVVVEPGQEKKQREEAKRSVEAILNRQVFRANMIVDKQTTYSIPSQELHFTGTLAALTFFYPLIAALGAIALVVFSHSYTADTASLAITASFIIVSLISLADQQVLNFLALIAKVDWRNAANKSALKDGKAINLALTALLTLIGALIKLKT